LRGVTDTEAISRWPVTGSGQQSTVEPMDAGTKPTTYLELHDSSRRVVAGEIVAEAPLSVHINGQEWVSLMCTPVGLEDLVLGFLLSEGVIESPADVRMMEVAHRGQVADVWLRKPHVQLPDRRTVTSGCGGGVTFADLAASREAIQSGRCISVRQVFDLMDELKSRGRALPAQPGHTHLRAQRCGPAAGRRGGRGPP